jgi:ribonuclease VapC
VGAACVSLIAGAIEPVTEGQARIARQAYRDFGNTSGHPAKLNFGDCFSYALAKTKGEPLLFKGQDFSRTDVKSARGKSAKGKLGNVPELD